MTYDGRAIANFILDYCDRQSRPITHMALQKIVYFCHVWSLIELHRPLIKHKFEAWEHGPVLPYLYRDFRSFERLPIKGRAKQIDPADGESREVKYHFDADTLHLVERITEFYSRM